MHAKDPTAEELATFGFTLDDLDDSAFFVWPDNLPAVNAFIAMATQWRTGAMGATGLDYTAIPPVLELTGIDRVEWPDTFECVRVMEAEAMKIMGKQAR